MTQSKRQESINNYVQTATLIRSTVSGLSEELLLWKPTEQAWSIQEIVGHLLDSNFVNSYRIRKIIAEPVTPIATFAHEQWVESQQVNTFQIQQLLAAYDAVTTVNSLLLAKLSEEQWQKHGTKAEEPISVEHIIDSFICKHVNKHIGQIQKNITAFENR